MHDTPSPLLIFPVPSFPMVGEGDDLAMLVVMGCEAAGIVLQDGDILVLAQKILSKAEARSVRLDTVMPSEAAYELAGKINKDPRLTELILQESREILRARPGVVIVEHRLGIVLANAGIDASNIDHAEGESVLLLPEDPDESAGRIRSALRERTGADLAVLIIDSVGRAWRSGTIGTAIGASGMPTLLDLRGRPDLYGRKLETTELGFADEVASAASLLMGQADEGCPAVIVRGLPFDRGDGAPASALQRPRGMDMFR